MSTSMEIIVRTAHGGADVNFRAPDDATTVRDLIAGVTNQAAPNAALLDGRIVDTSARLTDIRLHVGSLLNTDLNDGNAAVSDNTGSMERPTVDGISANIALGQVTGPGAGAIRELDVGEYRVGPGWRCSADELSFASVSHVEFGLVVADSGQVSVLPHGSSLPAIRLNGVALTEPTVWSSGLLVCGPRSFVLVPTDDQVSPLAAPDSAGRVAHNRPPGRFGDDSILSVDAVLDAKCRRAALWQRNGPGSGQLKTPVGLGEIDLRNATIDLAESHTIGIVGQRSIRTAHARSLLVEAVTRFGPADMEIVIATSTRQVGDWDWAKWLPHIRNGPSFNLLRRVGAVENWVQSQRADRTRTLLIVDDATWWTDPSSPLRETIINGQPNVTVISLSDDRSDAPSSCGSLIQHTSDGSCTLIRIDRNGARLDLLAPLVDVTTAADVAQSIATLRDPNRANAAPTDSPLTGFASVVDLLGFSDDDESQTAAIEARWDTALGSPGKALGLPIGVLDGERFSVDIGIDRHVLVSGSDIVEAARVTETLLLGAAGAWSPTEVAILSIDHRIGRRDDPIEQLPHHAGTFSGRGPAAAEQLINRLSAELLGDDPSSRRLIVSITSPDQSELAAPGLLAGLTRLANNTPGFHLIVATDLPIVATDRGLQTVASIEVTVDRVGGMRRALLFERHTDHRTPFTPFQAQGKNDGAIEIRPFYFGRSPSPLERQLERRIAGDTTTDTVETARVDQLISIMISTAERRGWTKPATLIPRSLPDEVDADELRAEHPGDGVPLALMESSSGDPEPMWWTPGVVGSLLFYGTARSGSVEALDTLMVGVVHRFAADDVTITMIDSTGRRERAVRELAHVGATLRHDHLDDVAASIARLHALLDDPAESAHLLVIYELDRLVDGLASRHDAALEQLADIIQRGGATQLNVVATASQTTLLGPLSDAFERFAVGSLGDPDEYAALGIDDPASIGRHRARFVMLPEHHRVQVATLGSDLDIELHGIGGDE